MIKPLLLSAAIVASRSRFRPPSVAAMSTSSSSAANNNKECGGEGRSAVIFLHGLGDVSSSKTYPAGWSSLEDDLPDIRRRLGDVHYVFPAPPSA
ncbi:hypothetical protein ACHAW5_000559 [Stephanodiscus triporus]|uniref:Phospholipase/carboxylesterase/thioesterase domain-containing protein n=1 Tax=Stephanodiscus triporus TaxID=2934178 RepID=A0ABD3NNM4_9STRA